MQPLTRHGHRGHAVFVLPARPRRAAGTGRQPHPPREKRAQPQAERPARHIAAKNPASRAKIWANHTPCHAAPPAAPPRKSPVSHTPRHAAGRPRAAKARAVWQPRRARPCRKNTPVGRRAATPSPRPSHFRAQSGQPRKNWAAPDRTHRPSPAVKTIRQQRAPVPKRAPPPIRAGGAFPVCPFRSFLQHEPQRAIAKASAARSPKQQRDTAWAAAPRAW